MKFVINDSQLFYLLDTIFPDLSVKKVRSQNPTYIIEYNDDEMFHYENGSVIVSSDFIAKLLNFVPINIDKGIVITIAKWFRSKTGLKPRDLWIGLKEYKVGGHLNESSNIELKKFDRNIIKDYGKYGKQIEQLCLTYLESMGSSICDLICLNTKTNNVDNYIVLIISSHYLSSNFETKLGEFIKNFFPVDIMVMVNVNHNCNKQD